jgi:Ni2+-binding GTPase involved in maturation of urease and hydrogenase
VKTVILFAPLAEQVNLITVSVVQKEQLSLKNLPVFVQAEVLLKKMDLAGHASLKNFGTKKVESVRNVTPAATCARKGAPADAQNVGKTPH